MIITRAPYRISFFGGGTDIENWFSEYGGGILSTTIDKYVYVSVKRIKPFHGHKIRVVWNQVEQVLCYNEIKNPIVREVLKTYFPNCDIEIHYNADLPARSGMGSSSAFCVALIGALSTLHSTSISKHELAKSAITIERAKLKEAGGIQDQIATSYGGFNNIVIFKNGDFTVKKINNINNLKKIEDNLLMFFTGKTRYSHLLMEGQLKEHKNNVSTLQQMASLVDKATAIIESDKEIFEFGELMKENWLLKNSLSKLISTEAISSIIEIGLSSGATAAKVLGAGGGGFVLFFVNKDSKNLVREKLKKLIEVPIRFESSGFKVIYNSEEIE